MDSPSFWRPGRQDRLPLLLILLVPVLIALPQLLGIIRADPMLLVSGAARGIATGFLPGSPFVDPNAGFTAQPLGRLGAYLWLHFQVPWWNSYTGIGLPLAAEYQSNVMSPLALFLLLPRGLVWQHMVLQIIAGSGCYGLARQFGLGRTAALAGGMLLALDGTFAWFADAPPGPGAFLPWVLLGIEHAAIAARLRQSGGWRLLGVAMAAMLLAGFPETAFINGLMALVFAALRLVQVPYRAGFIWRVGLGGVAGVLVAAPQILAFLEILPLSLLGPHTGPFAHYATPALAVVPSLLAPYAYGPIGGFNFPTLWARMGGYVDLPLLMIAVVGWWARRDALAWLLGGWVVLALTKVFGLEPFTALWNLVPGVASTGFFRYAAPSWELATILLAARGIEAMAHGRARIWIAALVGAIGICVGVGYGVSLWTMLGATQGLHVWALVSAGWVVACGVALLWLMRRPSGARVAAGLLMLDAALLFVVPVLSYPRKGKLDRPAIAFLREHLGMQRFYSLSPITPNYGAYFRIASINHNYIPLPRLWGYYITTKVDYGVNKILFVGKSPRAPFTQSAEHALQTNLPAFEELGVKYVLAPPGENPFITGISTHADDAAALTLPLAAEQNLRGEMVADASLRVASFGVSAGFYDNHADGTLLVTLCAEGKCQTGTADLTSGRDGKMLFVDLAQPLAVAVGDKLTFTLAHRGGRQAVALYLFGGGGQSIVGPAGSEPGMGLQLVLRPAIDPSSPFHAPVFSDDVMEIYQLPAPKPYFEAACRLTPASRTALVADCAGPATLVRRELFFPGWKASVGGKPAAIVMSRGVFQSIALPAGSSEVRFTYAPPHIIWAWLAFWLGLAMLAVRRINPGR